MELLNFILRKKAEYERVKVDFRSEMKTANKLGFMTEFAKLERDKNYIVEILDLLEEIAIQVQKNRVFTEEEISKLQSNVHKITGDGEVNTLLGINVGGGS